MKTAILPFILLGFFACNSPAPQQPASGESSQAASGGPVAPAAAEDHPYGCFVGMFEADIYKENANYSWANKITVCIDSLKNGMAYGRSYVAGNSRPFSGPYDKRPDDTYRITGKEPGDDRYDGVFEFTLDTRSDTLRGIWRSNDSKLSVTQRKYDLVRRVFAYDPTLELPDYVGWADLYSSAGALADKMEFLTDAVLKLNPSAKELKPSDVENMYRGDLEVIRNSIYARHGYTFRNRKIRYVFDMVDWYMPYAADVRDQLTDLEKKNIDLLQRYEKHSARYYDVYGR